MLKGTKTEMNLLAAFAGEAQAHTKYEYYSQKAKSDGYNQIAKIFDETSTNEKAHAEIWFKLLNNSCIPSTLENLNDACAGEHYEWTEMYAEFAKTAREEGFDNIAFSFEQVAKIEREHEERYSELMQNIEENKVFKKDEKVTWICTNCGHLHIGEKAPQICPVCSHPQAFFAVKN
ncbi:MAG: rubrerythrin family protein [Clostridia bacterium]